MRDPQSIQIIFFNNMMGLPAFVHSSRILEFIWLGITSPEFTERFMATYDLVAFGYVNRVFCMRPMWMGLMSDSSIGENPVNIVFVH